MQRSETSPEKQLEAGKVEQPRFLWKIKFVQEEQQSNVFLTTCVLIGSSKRGGGGGDGGTEGAGGGVWDVPLGFESLTNVMQ